MVKNITLSVISAAAAVMITSSFIVLRPSATVYKADPAQSKITWIGKKVTGEHSGTVKLTEGSVTINNNVLTGGSFTIDVSAITVTDITDPGTNAKLVGHLKSADFFNTTDYPNATLVITSAVLKSKGTYDITGNLTIKGISNPVTFPATVAVLGDKVTAVSAITIDRTKYDIKYRSTSFFGDLGDKAIDNNFVLNVTLVAVK